VLKCLCGLLLWFGDEDIRGETALDRNINIALLLLLGKHIKWLRFKSLLKWSHESIPIVREIWISNPKTIKARNCRPRKIHRLVNSNFLKMYDLMRIFLNIFVLLNFKCFLAFGQLPGRCLTMTRAQHGIYHPPVRMRLRRSIHIWWEIWIWWEAGWVQVVDLCYSNECGLKLEKRWDAIERRRSGKIHASWKPQFYHLCCRGFFLSERASERLAIHHFRQN